MESNTSTVTTTVPQAPQWRMRFCSLGSGSSGNCAYVGSQDEGILIDCGIDEKRVAEQLRRNGIAMSQIKGIVLTHDHADHTRYVYRMLRNNRQHQIRVYCTPKLLNGLLRNHNVSRRIKDYHEAIFKEFPFKIAGLTITAFETSHDATDNMGFIIQGGGSNFVVVTDTGKITERSLHYMKQANYLMLESNYDAGMLARGRYPEYLKTRVRGDKGHLDNAVAAETVRSIYSPQLKWVFLCHLSADNNTPEIALGTMRQALQQCGATVGDATMSVATRDAQVQLAALPRYDASPWWVL